MKDKAQGSGPIGLVFKHFTLNELQVTSIHFINGISPSRPHCDTYGGASIGLTP